MIFDEAGEPLAGPKVKEFDRVIAERFAPLDVYLAAAFASQTGAGSVLRMSRSDRRALFGQLLGLERLEALATAARDRARAAESEMTATQAALDAIRSGAVDLANLTAELVRAQEALAVAAGQVKVTEDRVATARAERERLAQAVDAAERTRKDILAAQARAGECREAVAQAKARRDEQQRNIDVLGQILAAAPEIRARATRIQELSVEMDQVRGAGEAAAAEKDKLNTAAAAAAQAETKADYDLADARRAAKDACDRAAEAKRRMAAAKEATNGVPCAAVLADEDRGACPALKGHFLTVAEASNLISAYEEARPALEAKISAALANRDKALPAAAAAKEAWAHASTEVDSLRLRFRALKDQVDKLRAVDRSAELTKAETEVGILRSGMEVLDQAVRAAIAEYDRASKEHEDRKAALVNVDQAGYEAARATEAGAEADLRMANEAAMIAHGAIARIEAQLAAARDAQVKAEALSAKLAPMERSLATWRWLGRGLGREGVQALELDAAGPRVSGLANELLTDAYGPRFQIRLETQAAKADGKGVKETFDVVVVDTERGREGNGEDLSGGEKVIVGEALGLAVGLFHAQAAGVSLGTVVRDETVGALDPENGERYLAMLRAFLRVGQVHQLLYVAHSPALVELADAVIHVADGRIEVR